MAATEGNWFIKFDVSNVNEEGLHEFEKLIQEYLEEHSQDPETWRFMEWLDCLKAPEYVSESLGANSDDVMYDIRNFLDDAAVRVPGLIAEGNGDIQDMAGGEWKLNYQFSLEDGKVVFEEDKLDFNEEFEDGGYEDY